MSKNLTTWLKNLGLNDSEIKYTIRKIMKIFQRTSCCRNREWFAPELLDW